MLISNVLIMIGGAVGNSATITITHLLYHYREAPNSSSAGCLGKTSSALMDDLFYCTMAGSKESSVKIHDITAVESAPPSTT